MIVLFAERRRLFLRNNGTGRAGSIPPHSCRQQVPRIQAMLGPSVPPMTIARSSVIMSALKAMPRAPARSCVVVGWRVSMQSGGRTTRTRAAGCRRRCGGDPFLEESSAKLPRCHPWRTHPESWPVPDRKIETFRPGTAARHRRLISHGQQPQALDQAAQPGDLLLKHRRRSGFGRTHSLQQGVNPSG